MEGGEPYEPYWQTRRWRLSLSEPQVMAIINVTPDSFSGDGVGEDYTAAIRRAEQAVEAGAAIVDFGGESTRPGASPVPAAEEWRRLAPVLTAVRDWPVVISVDTRKPEVMERAVAAGVDVLNDVAGFRTPAAVAVAARAGCGVVVMHMQGEPASMQVAPYYEDVVGEVEAFLRERSAALQAAGVKEEQIVWDPGFGFGKSFEHNIALFQALPRLAAQRPVLVGVSRKRMIGELTGVEKPAERAVGSIAAALAAVARGARIVRAHDVRATVEALRVWQRLGPRWGDAEARV
ncbi:MAG: dihydropteroate synthase [Hydrogenophilus sp.]|nr:dihydropteroate synthase [Hydrogenophilus sp.]